MKHLSGLTGIITCVILVAACQPQQQQTPPTPPPANGKIFTGELSGNAFAIATGDEYQDFMDMVDAFNRMDAQALWAHSADTVSFRRADGKEGPLTQADMAGMFATADSLDWSMNAVIPVQVTGTKIVKIIADSRETIYSKDGNVSRTLLLEEFTFDKGTMVAIRQWTADTEAD